ncbi:MAG: hypothetical protein ACI8R9_002204 [Paraglaciecola sp.]|jgi:hypothetical protein
MPLTKDVSILFQATLYVPQRCLDQVNDFKGTANDWLFF